MTETHGTCPRPPACLLPAPLRTGEGVQALAQFVHHRDLAFPTLFVRLTKGVDGRGIDRVYVNALKVLARRLRDGSVRDATHLRRVCDRVLRCLGRHHEYLAHKRDDPRRSVGAAAARDNPDGAKLFARGVDAADVAVTTVEPVEYARRNEMLAAVRRGARLVGLLHVRAFQAYRRYEFEFGKTHGAYVHLARLAVLDEAGRVVKLRSWRVTPDRPTRPDTSVIRQVRAIHLRACDRVREAARRLGYDLPPGV